VTTYQPGNSYLNIVVGDVLGGSEEIFFEVLFCLLMEQDFGYYEGKSFAARQNTGTLSVKEAHRAMHKDDPGFVDVESKDAMALRVDAFLDDHLYPIMDSDATGQEHIVAIVSHGILLSVLWRRLLLRLPPKSVSLHPEILAKIGQLDLERLGGWSNTGYLDLKMRRINEPQLAVTPSASTNTNTASSPPKHDAESPATPFLSLAVPTDMGKSLTGWSMTILAVNSRDHLTGLKRTRGGVGSARHDPSQQSISSFFNKQKKE